MNDVVTWKPGTPDAISGLTFGTDAFSSIIVASSAAGAGDTVFIAAGTYSEGNEIYVAKDLSFVGDGPGLTILDGASSHALFEFDSSTTIADLPFKMASPEREPSPGAASRSSA